ncbi:hypothetical protein UA08_01651 [Talaromyces atroroseus]|uniref:AB hydrolase-1 domain-containing protein n=1 Tax=Talaromyces atroroseus TaxID=1441469 RepID=A0A1Q5QA00_TALAT|nr:hypothetical protein UA08_01651 [Talaromyces atroroseus]OKL62648.1 hypothetical protein UA08_01651 [Talaromyces atroroseus]
MSPTVLLVPGAWCPPSVFDPLRDRLDVKGIASAVVALPSVGADPATTTIDDDIAYVRTELFALIDADAEVILAAHSYGGVVLITYMTAFVVPKGTRLKQMLGGEVIAYMELALPRQFFKISPLPPTIEQAKWTSVLTHSALGVFLGTATYEPWYTIPTAFIICEEDRALPPPVQEQMAQLLCTDLLYRVKSSHSVFLSNPERVAEILKELIGKVALKSGV